MKGSGAFDAKMKWLFIRDRGIAVLPDEIQSPLLCLKDAVRGRRKVLLETDVLDFATSDHGNRNELLMGIDTDAIGTGYLNRFSVLLNLNNDTITWQIRGLYGKNMKIGEIPIRIRVREGHNATILSPLNGQV